ncbi:MAG: hypothetical protein J0J15_10275 [Mesorhizobium sp.]|nr:hypothetical protein [Mesorhizobium sp.]
MDQDFDLCGNPLVRTDTKLGRPEHEPTEENIIFIMVLLAGGMTQKEVADTLGLSVPTLRKHYLHLLKQRDRLFNRLRTKLRVAQIQQGLSGNASALNAALSMLDKINTENVQRKVESRGHTSSAQRQKLGKKEERQRQAEEIASGSGKFAPPQPPQLVVNNR